MSVNGTVVDSVVDEDAPILRGIAGLGVTGQPGLVVEFEDFTYAEFVEGEEAPGESSALASVRGM